MKQPAQEPHGRLRDRIALVTGAASGIGRATALLLAREGARVAVADVDAEGAERTAEQIVSAAGQAMALSLDVASEESWIAAVQRVLGAWGRLNILVNNAGVAAVRPVTDTDVAGWRQLMAVNLDGVFLGTKHAMRAMRQAGGGCIVNVSSVAGLRPYAQSSAYGASKAAVRHFTKVAALEGGADGIRVNTVLPGGVITPIWEKTEHWADLMRQHGSPEVAFKKLAEDAPLKRFAAPEEIAEAILFLVSDQAAFITGADLIVDGGASL